MIGSSILEKALRRRQIDWGKEGLTLYKIPMFLGAVYLELQRDHLLELNIGKEKAAHFIYELGLFQGEEAFNILAKYFGFSKKIKDKSKLLDYQTGQGELSGRGSFRWVRKDFKNKFFIAQGKSIYAINYRRIKELSMHPVDHLIRGIAAKFVELIIGEPCICEETKCIAKGNSVCEFVVRPKSTNYLEDDHLIKGNIFTKDY